MTMPREADPRNIFDTLQTQQRELLVLAEMSGLQADPAIYRIIIELLNLQIEPDAIYKLLKHMRRCSKAGKQLSGATHKKNI